MEPLGEGDRFLLEALIDRPALRQFFFGPLRRHGEVEHGREVSFLELFSDLVYVVIVGQAAHEVHDREDGRSRTNFFQMGLIALMAVLTGHATGTDGPAFATVYIILFAWYTYQWWAVHRIDDPVYHRVTTRYLAGMLATIAAMGISIVVPGEVVIGVVEGLNEVEDRTALTVAVAMLGLAVGMGLWWNYYDVLGRRVPSQNGVRLATWT